MPDTKKESFINQLSSEDRIVISFTRYTGDQHDQIKEFAIVYQTKIDNIKWKPAVRFDSPHDSHKGKIFKQIHQHQYFLNKPRITLAFPDQDSKSAMTEAIAILNKKWENYKSNFWGSK